MGRGMRSPLSLLAVAGTVSICASLVLAPVSAGEAAVVSHGTAQAKTTAATVAAPTVTGPASAALRRPGFDETQSSARCSGKSGWDGTFRHGLGVGLTTSKPCPGLDRAYFQFSLPSTLTGQAADGVHLQSAVLHLAEIGRADRDCSRSWPLDLYQVGTIGRHTSWRNQPRVTHSALLASVRLRTRKARSGCAGQSVTVSVLASFSSAAASHATTWTVVLVGDERQSPANDGFMAFASDPYIVTTYDVTPPTPTASSMTTTPVAQTSPGTPSNGCPPQSTGWINSSTVTLQAQLTPAVKHEPVQGRFRLLGATGSVLSTPESGYVKPGANGKASVSVPAGVTLADGHTYSWQVASAVAGDPAGSDGPYVSALSPECTFSVDLTPPDQPTVSSANFPPAGPAAAYTGTFAFSSSDPVPACSGCTASGVSEFKYALDAPASSGTTVSATTGSSGVASATSGEVYPDTWGTHVLNVEAIDAAGNVSAPASYTFLMSSTTQVPLISSPQVVDGSGKSTDTFTFSSENATDSSCSPSPCGTDISGYAYQVNSNAFPVDPPTIPVTISDDIATASVSVSFGGWGEQSLWVEAVDVNGDITQPVALYFYIPSTTAGLPSRPRAIW
jgi:hypothetical protein